MESHLDALDQTVITIETQTTSVSSREARESEMAKPLEPLGPPQTMSRVLSRRTHCRLSTGRQRVEKGDEFYLHRLDLDTYRHFRDNLITLYREIFAQPPYNESFDPIELDEEFTRHISDGNYLFALSTQKVYTLNRFGDILPMPVVGFLFLSTTKNFFNRMKTGSTIQSQSGDISEQSVKSKLMEFIPMTHSLYVDDLAIADSLQGCGLGRKIFEWVFTMTKGYSLYLRTNDGAQNHKVINFYQKLGFKIIPVVEIVVNTRTDQSISSDSRIYMLKS